MHKPPVLIVLIILGLGIQAAQADTWSRTGPRMEVERNFDGSGSGTVSRDLQNGATASRSTSCNGNPWLVGCSSTIDLQTQSGDEYTVDRNTAAGRYRGGSVTSLTGPEGNTVVSPRRWRR